jgi:hypothetical protein
LNAREISRNSIRSAIVIYCIGDRARYEAKLATGEPLFKAGRGMRNMFYYEGGSVWQAAEDARAFIIRNNLEASRAVYGVLADWETDTLQVPREPFRRLVKTSQIVRLPGDGDGDGSVSVPADEAAGKGGVGQS